MSIMKSATGLVAGAALSLGAAAWVSAASAADMPVKAAATPTVGASVPLDVHGYLEFQFASNRITPGGLRIYPDRGYLYHIDIGLSIDLYKNPTGFINKFQVYGGIWNEFWSSPPEGGQQWQERDWWVGFTVGFAQHWSFSFSHVQFKLPGGPTAYNYAFSLGYDDSHLGYWLTFNPFINVFYNAAGFTNIPTGTNTYRVEIGVKPSFSLQKGWDIPLTVTFPTWVTVAPDSYYNRNDGTTDLCGTTGTMPCSLSNLGMVSTGLQLRYALTQVPKRLGNWYVRGGVQYYHLFNDALLASQVILGAANNYDDAERDAFVWTGAVGFTF
jgi:hypothetical protein